MHPRTLLTAALLGFAGLAAAAIGLLAQRGGFNFPMAAAVVVAPGIILAWLLANKLAAALRVPPLPRARAAEAPASVPPDDSPAPFRPENAAAGQSLAAFAGE